MQANQRRLIEAAWKAESEREAEARLAVLAHYKRISIKQAQKALSAALALPKQKRPAAIRGVLQLISEASKATGVPPADLLTLTRQAVKGRVLNSQDLAQLTNPAFLYGDTRELEAHAVQHARKRMNDYWADSPRKFRDDVARVVREAIRKGLDPEQAAELLQERLDVSRSRAVNICRDQLRTAAARADEEVQRAAGVKEYDWFTNLDGHERDAHALLHGTRRKWADRSQYPGHDINCRCRGIPIPPYVSPLETD